jgi:hypothetical protein
MADGHVRRPTVEALNPSVNPVPRWSFARRPDRGEQSGDLLIVTPPRSVRSSPASLGRRGIAVMELFPERKTAWNRLVLALHRARSPRGRTVVIAVDWASSSASTTWISVFLLCLRPDRGRVPGRSPDRSPSGQGPAFLSAVHANALYCAGAGIVLPVFLPAWRCRCRRES